MEAMVLGLDMWLTWQQSRLQTGVFYLNVVGLATRYSCTAELFPLVICVSRLLLELSALCTRSAVLESC